MFLKTRYFSILIYCSTKRYKTIPDISKKNMLTSLLIYLKNIFPKLNFFYFSYTHVLKIIFLLKKWTYKEAPFIYKFI